MSQKNSVRNKDLVFNSTSGHFWDNFIDLNRNSINVKIENKLVDNLNTKLRNKFKGLNEKLVTKNLSSTRFDFLNRLKEYSWKAKGMAKDRFNKMMKVIKPENNKGKENDFFSDDNIRTIFLEFAENSEKIEDSKNVKAEDRNKLADDFLNDNYKILAIYYFAGILSAKDLDYFLRKLEPIQDILNKDTNPGWFERFCSAAKTFFKSLIDRNVKKINLDLAGFYLGNDGNRRKKIIESRHKGVFDKLRKTTVEIGAQNCNQNTTKAQNKIKKNDLLK